MIAKKAIRAHKECYQDTRHEYCYLSTVYVMKATAPSRFDHEADAIEHRKEDVMKTFVLIHGGHHGGWAWRSVARDLRSAGHEVITPTLTGLGDRAHLMSESVTVQTHITDVLNVLYYEDLHDVVLVAHSYAGIIATAVARRTDRVSHVIFIDAQVPVDGESFLDLLPPIMRLFLDQMIEPGRITYPVVQGILDQSPGWAAERLVAQPAIGLDQPIELGSGATTKPAMTYWIATVGPSACGPYDDWYAPWIDRFKSQGVPIREYAGDHEVILSDPKLTVSLILESVQGDDRGTPERDDLALQEQS